MKRATILSLLLLMATSIMAQSVKIVPKMKKGDVKTYVGTGETSVQGQMVRTSHDDVYTVTDKTKNGFVVQVESNLGNTKTDINFSNLTQVLEKVFANQIVIYDTNKEGKIINVRNLEEQKKHAVDVIDEIFNSAQMQQMNVVLPRENIMKMVEEKFSSENMLKMALSIPSPLNLNGKTISEGMEEESFNMQGLKLKTIYHLSNGGKTIIADSNLDMNVQEIKEYLVKQVKQLMPSLASMFEGQIDQALQRGTVKVSARQKATYEIGDDGWVRQLTVDSESAQTGQVNKSIVVLTLK